MNDEQRLAAYDAFARDAREELAGCNARMETLRAEGKTKIATYRQLFANRMTLTDIVRRLEDHGL